MRAARAILAIMMAATLSACSVPGPGAAPDGIHDPNEEANRRVHAFNKSIDERFLGGNSDRERAGVPDGIKDGVANFADTVSLPQTVTNQILQGRLGDATRNTLRFAINATLGFGGLADVATDLGLPEDESDFGETLYVWGVPEGAYQELPLLGPSTQRATAGKVVDLFTNPLDRVLTLEQRRVATAAKIADKAMSRAQYSDSVDSLLYDSADSYAQLRLIYLQNRRFELGYGSGSGDGADAGFVDPEAVDTEGF